GYGRICCGMLDMDKSTPPAEGHHHPQGVCRLANSIVVQDRAEATVPGEQRVAAEPEQVEVEGLVGLLLAVALDLDGDGLRRLAGGEGQRAGPGDVIAVAGGGSAADGAVRQRHRLVISMPRRQVKTLDTHKNLKNLDDHAPREGTVQ